MSSRILQNLLKNQSVKRYLTTGVKNMQTEVLEKSTHITKEKIGNTSITSIKYITSTLSNMNKKVKIGLGLYTVGIGLHNLTGSYNAGTSALYTYRQSNSSPLYNPNVEWSTVYDACRQESYNSALSSVVWPVTLAGKFAPTLVIAIH
jgi:hypothetical protein